MKCCLSCHSSAVGLLRALTDGIHYPVVVSIAAEYFRNLMLICV